MTGIYAQLFVATLGEGKQEGYKKQINDSSGGEGASRASAKGSGRNARMGGEINAGAICRMLMLHEK
jgi:hypothetical protein